MIGSKTVIHVAVPLELRTLKETQHESGVRRLERLMQAFDETKSGKMSQSLVVLFKAASYLLFATRLF